MNASCVACRARGSGMVAIYQHPNGLDQMFTSVTGVEVESEDNLCIPCYDDLKAAHIFKQKCIQNNILRISRSPAIKSGSGSQIRSEATVQSEEVSVKAPAPTPEISTTSIGEADILDLEEHLDIRSEVSDGEDSDLQDDEDDEDDDVEEIKVGLTELDSVQQIQPIMLEDSKPVATVQSTSGHDIEIVNEVKLEPIRCEECDKVFTKTSLLQRHMKSCHPAESTDDNDQLAPGALATLPSVHNMMCEYCFKEFTSLPEKFDHEAAHVTEQKPYKCPQCQGTFKDKVGLRSHIRIHSAVKRYKCQYCEMRFHQRGNLTAHERTHVGAKPFLCPHCGKGFAESGNLKNHIRFHTGERPYACSECPKRFRTHYSRTVHFRSHSNDRPFRCTECEKGFYSSGKLIIHRRVHSGEKPYTCGTCPAKFADSSGLKRHSKTH